MNRIETGALQIDDDWTGLFIRGDAALYLSELIKGIYMGIELSKMDIDWLYDLSLDIDINVNHHSGKRKFVQQVYTSGAANLK